MSKLIAGGESYALVAPSAMYESDYVRRLVSNASELFPWAFTIPFDEPLRSQEGSAAPDLALVDRSYRAWWLLEVELCIHSLGSHVEPQVRRLLSGQVEEPHFVALCDAEPRLDPSRLSSLMFLGAHPGVHVIVNAPVPDWVGPLKNCGATLSVIEVYRSGRNREVLRLFGEDIAPDENLVTRCRRDPLLPNGLLVDSPGALPVANGGCVTLTHRDGVSEWRRFDSGGAVWLLPVGRSPLDAQASRFDIRSIGGTLNLIGYAHHRRGR